MKPQRKIMLKNFLIAGNIYAIALAIFDFSREKGFSIKRYFYNAIVFGFFMSLVVLYDYKRREKNKK